MEGSMNNTSSVDRATRIEVAANQAASVEVLAGAAIQCTTGKLWLTQDGDTRDHVVSEGTTFCTDRSGRVVLTAVDGASVVVVRKAPGYRVPGTVTIDSLERVTRSARAAQAKFVARLVMSVVEWAVSALRRVLGADKPAHRSTSLPRSPVVSSSKGSRRTGSAASADRAPERVFRGVVRSL
jgi:hypothetical protein